MPVRIVWLLYCRTIPDLPLHKTRLHLVLSSRGFGGKGEESRCSFHCYSGLQTRGQMCFHSMDAADRGYKRVSMFSSWRQCRGGQKCMSRVRRSLWITLLRIKIHSAHGSASHVPGVRAIRGLLHTSGCAWLLWYICAHPQPVHWGCPGGNAVTLILQPNLQQFQQMFCWRHLCSPVFPDTLSKTRSNSRVWVCVLGWSSIPVDAHHVNGVFVHGKRLSLSLNSCLKDTGFVSQTLSFAGPSAHFQCGMKDLGV